MGRTLGDGQAHVASNARELMGVSRNRGTLDDGDLRGIIHEQKARAVGALLGKCSGRCQDVGGRAEVNLAVGTLLQGKLAAGANDVVRTPELRLALIALANHGPGALVLALGKGRRICLDPDGGAKTLSRGHDAS